VQTLFYPHAVRRRYWLDHKAQNLQAIHEVGASFALAGDLNLSVTVDSKVLIQVAKQSRAQRIRSVLGSGVSRGLISGHEPLDWQPGAAVEYFTASPTSGTNGRMFLNVNGRPCTSPALARAVKQEFRLCAGPKAPTVLLWLAAPRAAFSFLADEPLIAVTFCNEGALRKDVSALLRRAWASAAETLSIPRALSSEPPEVAAMQSRALAFESPVTAQMQPCAVTSEPPGVRAVQPCALTFASPVQSRPLASESPPRRGSARVATPGVRSDLTGARIAAQFARARAGGEYFGESRGSITTASFAEMKIIGQWNRSFIVTRLGADIYAIDQHAACEAANFERFRLSGPRGRQRLLQPLVVAIPPDARENAVEHRQKLAELGFEYDVLDDSVRLLTIPAGEEVARGAADFQELLALVDDAPDSQVMTQGARSQLAYHACHASVRAGDPMSHAQMRALLGRMAASDYPWNCPHGRPTWCCISRLPDGEPHPSPGGEWGSSPPDAEMCKTWKAEADA
jgi:DNA mismatch repair ATPase MutL